MAKKDENPPPDFESAMRELESLVQAMEQGEFTLEDSIKQFERGMELTRICQRALGAAEQKVLQLAGQPAAESLEDFELGDEQPD